MARRRSNPRSIQDRRLSELAHKQRWTAPDARAVLQAHADSGQSVAAFARRLGLAPWRLYDWQRRLPRRGEKPGGAAPSFLPVRIVPSSGQLADPGDPSSGIEIVLGGGRRIRVGATFDPAVLARVLEVLEQASC
jgi:transposase-like protein